MDGRNPDSGAQSPKSADSDPNVRRQPAIEGNRDSNAFCRPVTKGDRDSNTHCQPVTKPDRDSNACCKPATKGDRVSIAHCQPATRDDPESLRRPILVWLEDHGRVDRGDRLDAVVPSPSRQVMWQARRFEPGRKSRLRWRIRE